MIFLYIAGGTVLTVVLICVGLLVMPEPAYKQIPCRSIDTWHPADSE